MADIFGIDDLSVKDISPLDTVNTRRAYNKDSCMAKHMRAGKSKEEASELCKK